MNNSLESIANYLQEQKEILENIYNITERNRFVGEESEIDAFDSYLDLRQSYFDDLDKIEEIIKDDIKTINDNNNSSYREINQKFTDIKIIKARILEIDIVNNANMKKVYDSLSKSIVTITTAKKSRQLYNSYSNQISSSAIDSKN